MEKREKESKLSIALNDIELRAIVSAFVEVEEAFFRLSDEDFSKKAGVTRSCFNFFENEIRAIYKTFLTKKSSVVEAKLKKSTLKLYKKLLSISLSVVDDFEFATRTGVSIQETKVLIKKLDKVIGT